MSVVRWVAAAVLALPFVLRAGPGAHADEQEKEELTTGVWREPDPPLDLHYHLLALPERAVELAFTPAALLFSAFERYRIDQRLYDFLRNDEGTVFVVPDLKISGGDGFGIGATLVLDEYFLRDQDFEVGGLYRLNGDYELAAGYDQSFVRLEGRELDVEVLSELDQDQPFYGLGNDTDPEDERVLSDRFTEVVVSGDINARGATDYTGTIRLSYLRQELTPGSEPGSTPLEEGGAVIPPVGFGETNDYGRLGVRLRYDSRSTKARTQRGVLSVLDVGFTRGISRSELGAISLESKTSAYFEILPRRRVLILRGGVGMSTPLASDDVPLRELVTLGRKTYLRGYAKTRFRDRLGWWTSVEYTWPIYEYRATGVALSPVLFVDAGQVGGSPDEFFETPLRYDGGVAFRAAHETVLAADFTFAVSPEGTELFFNLGTQF